MLGTPPAFILSQDQTLKKILRAFWLFVYLCFSTLWIEHLARIKVVITFCSSIQFSRSVAPALAKCLTMITRDFGTVNTFFKKVGNFFQVFSKPLISGLSGHCYMARHELAISFALKFFFERRSTYSFLIYISPDQPLILSVSSDRIVSFLLDFKSVLCIFSPVTYLKY